MPSARGSRERVLAPGVPVDGVVGVLAQVGARLLRETVRHDAASRSRANAARVERTAGGLFDEPVPAERGRGREDVLAQVGAGRRGVDETAVAVAQLCAELRREQLPVEIVLVVDGHDGEMDLRGPVGGTTVFGATHALEALDEIPPEGVEVGLGVRVELAFEVRDHEHPASEDEQRRPLRGRELGARSATVPRARPAISCSQVGSRDEPAEHHRDAFGGERVRGLAEQPRELGIELAVVHCVAELVEHGVGPPFVRLDVAEDAHVALAVDVDAERVLVLPVARVEVARVEYGVDVEVEAGERAAGEGFEVGVGEVPVEVDRTLDRGILEERVVEVPRREVVAVDAEPVREPVVEFGLPCGERRRGEPVDFVERGKEARLVERVGREREREVVAVAEGAGGVVAQASKLAHVVGDLGPDLLAGFPCRAPLVRVVARAQDLEQRVVVDSRTVEVGAVRGKARVDRGLEVDEGVPQVRRYLVRNHGVGHELEGTCGVAVGTIARGELLAYGREGVVVGQELATGEVGDGSAFVGVRRRVRARLPPREAELAVERGKPLGEGLDEFAAVAHVEVLPRTATVITVSSAQWMGSGMPAVRRAASTSVDSAPMPSSPRTACA